MNILVVIPYYVPAYSYGGPVAVAHDLNKAFVQKGYSVTIVTTDVHDASSRNTIQEEFIDGVKIIRFKNVSNYLAKNFNAYLPFGFKKWIKENLKNYDIVHCHDFFTYQNVVVSKYCKKFGVPFIVQPHGCLDSVRIEAKNSKVKTFFLNIFSAIFKNSKYIVALTKHEKNAILPFVNNSDKIKIIPNGIQTNEFKNISKINLHKKYNFSPETKLLFYFGRVQYIKGIDYIIQTLSKLKPSFKYHFFIIGPDERGEKAYLQKLISKYNLIENITFTGQLEGEEKKQFIASCDLSLFLSRGEGLPMTILEIAALGIPNILSRECYVPEIAKSGGGYEVEKENYAENAQLIHQHFQNELKIHQMQTNAQTVIKEKFELDVIVEKMLELYRNKN